MCACMCVHACTRVFACACARAPCQVWLLLEEKQISYRVEKVNMRCYGEKPFSYTSKYGQLLPAAEIDGQVDTLLF